MLVSTGMFHGGSHSFFMGGLNVGQALVIMAKFDPEETLRLIEQHARADRLHGADAVPPLPATPRRRAGQVRHVEPPRRRALGGAVPAAGEGGDARLVGPGDLGDLRRDGGSGHDRQAAPLAGEARHGRPGDPRRAPVGARRRRPRARPGRGRQHLHGERRRVRVPRRSRADPERRSRTGGSASATSATSTPTATCSSPIAPRT